jgi:hypothetical protein
MATENMDEYLQRIQFNSTIILDDTDDDSDVDNESVFYTVVDAMDVDFDVCFDDESDVDTDVDTRCFNLVIPELYTSQRYGTEK